MKRYSCLHILWRFIMTTTLRVISKQLPVNQVKCYLHACPLCISRGKKRICIAETECRKHLTHQFCGKWKMSVMCGCCLFMIYSKALWDDVRQSTSKAGEGDRLFNMYFCEKCETHIHKHALRYIKHTQTEIMLTAEDSMLNIQ